MDTVSRLCGKFERATETHNRRRPISDAAGVQLRRNLLAGVPLSVPSCSVGWSPSAEWPSASKPSL